MTVQRALRPSGPPENLIGSWRRFGPTGPAYQIVAVGPRGTADEPTLWVRVIETDEEIDYRLAELLDDPDA